MKKVLIIFLISISFAFSQKRILTLRECLEIGMSQNKEILISNAKQEYAYAKTVESSSYLLPAIRFNAGYSRLSNVDPFQISVPFSPVPVKISEAVLDNYTLNLSFKQPLFTGFRLINSVKATKLNYQSQIAESSKDKNEVAFKIHTAFWNLYKTILSKEMFANSLKQTQKHVENAKQFLANGLITKSDYLKIEIQHSAIKLQLIETENNFDIATMLLNQILGTDPGDTLEINPDIKETLQEVSDFQTLPEEGLNNRQELISLQLKSEAGSRSISAATALWFPSVYLSGNYYYNRPNQRYQPVADLFKNTWDLNVVLSWDLWNWRYNSSQVALAEQQKIQTDNLLELQKESVMIEIKQAILNFKRNKEKLELCKLTESQNEENLRIINEKFLQQLATSSDLLDAENSLIQAKTSTINSMIDLYLSGTKLQKSAGRKIY